ncbi:AAA domain-containing protein [Nocardia sp. CNY236]|uniref:AAA domain-containing protein n=1 Tax=Nocardia sp. CNY236 TaxID=1169152 RepID=UPI000415913E|nr:AAA domain-containing protein [Nocardia sp. CNY236]
MLDPRVVAIVIRRREGGGAEDKTLAITEYEPGSERVRVRFGGSKDYMFGRKRVTILDRPAAVPLAPRARLFVDGSSRDATEAYLFTGPPEAGSWWQLEFIHPASALSRILEQAPIEPRPDADVPLPVYPFRTNISQSEAVDNALRYPVSVIDDPPGTGKTQAILNIIASIICRRDMTVGVVSFNNSAVDNVVEKLTKEGFGMVAANLGRAEKRQEFFDGQGARNAAIDAMLGAGSAPAADTADALGAVSRRLAALLEQDRQRAELRNQLHAYRLEQRHFASFFDRHEVPDVDALPLLRRYSAGKLLDFIADTDPRWIRDRGWGRMVDTMNRYFKYRALRKVARSTPGGTGKTSGSSPTTTR